MATAISILLAVEIPQLRDQLSGQLGRLGYRVWSGADVEPKGEIHLVLATPISAKGPAIRKLLGERPVPVVAVIVPGGAGASAGGPDWAGWIVPPTEDAGLRELIDRVTRETPAGLRLAAYEQWIQGQLTTSGDAMIATDAAGRITLFNLSAERLLGYVRREALIRPLSQVVQLATESGAAVVAVPNGAPSRALVRTKENLQIAVDWVMTPLPAGSHSQQLLVIRPVDTVPEATRKQAEMRMREGQKLEALGYVVGGIAHDTNNLMTAILGNLGLVRMEPDIVKRVAEQLDDIERAALRASAVCRQVLAYSGRTRASFQPQSVNAVVGDCLKQAKANGLSAETRIQSVLGHHVPPVKADPVQLRQLVSSLISNAVDAIGNHGGVLSVMTSSATVDRAGMSKLRFSEEAEGGAYVVIEIGDTGSGLSPEAIEEILSPFYTTKQVGRGLGLALVGEILREHQGGLQVESMIGRGTTFRAYLPASVEAVTGAGATAGGAAQKGTVLIADDDEAVRALAKWVVERAGYKATTARDGDEALALFRADPGAYRLILLDLTMPRVSGHEVLAGVRALRPGVPVILVSGYSEDAVQANTKTGPLGFLQKPFSPEALRMALNKYAAMA